MKYFRFFLLGIFFLQSHLIFAQNNLRGVLYNAAREPVEFATVQYIQPKTNETLGFGISNKKGVFSFAAPDCPDCIVEIAHVNYTTFRKLVDSSKAESLEIVLTDKQVTLGEVTIKSTKVDLRYRNDTIKYDIESIRTGNEDKLKDLLRKIPGIEVSEGGQIKANGEVVDKLLINGQEFFGDNNSMATNNLAAKMVGAVSLLQNYKSNAQFGKFKNRNTQALDITIKDEYNGLISGELEALYAVKSRYKGHAILFRFDKKYSMSFIADANSLADFGVSIEDFTALRKPLDQDVRPVASTDGNENELPDFLLNQSLVKTSADQFTALNFMSKPTENLNIRANYLFNANQFDTQIHDEVWLATNTDARTAHDVAAQNRLWYSQFNLETNWNPTKKTLLQHNLRLVWTNRKANENIALPQQNFRNHTQNDELSLEQVLNFSYKQSARTFYSFVLMHHYTLQHNDFAFLTDKPFTNLGIRNNSTELQPSGQSFSLLATWGYRFGAMVFRADMGADISTEALATNTELNTEYANGTNTLNKSEYYARFNLYKNEGYFQYQLAFQPSLAHNTFGYTNFSRTLFLPDVFVKLSFNAMHYMQLGYSWRYTQRSVNERNTQSFWSEYDVLLQKSTLTDGGVTIDKSLKLEYFLVQMYHGIYVYANACAIQQTQPVGLATSFNDAFWVQQYRILPQATNYTSVVSAELNISPIKMRIATMLYGSVSDKAVFVQNQIQDAQNLYLYAKLSLLSFFKADLINYQVGVKHDISRVRIAQGPTQQSSGLSPFVECMGSVGNLNYEFSGTYELSHTQLTKTKVFLLDFYLKYKFTQSAWVLGLRGDNILNLRNTLDAAQWTLDGISQQRLKSRLPGFIGVFVRFNLI
jgi:hypothetical protein